MLPAVDPQWPVKFRSARNDTSHSHMVSIGMQRQLASGMALDSNFTFTGGRAEERRQNVNSAINPATGANYFATGGQIDYAHLPFPDVGTGCRRDQERSLQLLRVENTFTKRFSNRWQGNATYTLSRFKDDGPFSGLTGPYVVALDPGGEDHDQAGSANGAVTPDMGSIYQRWQARTSGTARPSTASGIWVRIPAAASYFFGSGQRLSTTWGSDLRNTEAPQQQILTPAGTTAAWLGAQCACTVKGQTLADGSFLLTALSSWASRSTAWTCASRSASTLAAVGTRGHA